MAPHIYVCSCLTLRRRIDSAILQLTQKQFNWGPGSSVSWFGSSDYYLGLYSSTVAALGDLNPASIQYVIMQIFDVRAELRCIWLAQANEVSRPCCHSNLPFREHHHDSSTVSSVSSSRPSPEADDAQYLLESMMMCG